MKSIKQLMLFSIYYKYILFPSPDSFNIKSYNLLIKIVFYSNSLYLTLTHPQIFHQMTVLYEH